MRNSKQVVEELFSGVQLSAIIASIKQMNAADAKKYLKDVLADFLSVATDPYNQE